MRKRILFCLVIILAFYLRFFHLGGNPPSLYWDEVSLGYNAYTIATSLRDEHGEFLPLDRFIAFGDYKPPGYVYASVPSVIFFGLNEFSIRFPSMIAGLFMVLLTYFLAKELFKNDTIALLSSLFLAVSPWALQFSRAAFEANLAACFNLLGIYLFIISIKKKWLIVSSVIFFILSFYTFNANRIIAPLILLGLSIIYWRNLINNKKWVLISLIIAIMMILPSARYLADRESRLRFQEVSIFNNLETIKVSNKRIAMDNNTWWANLIHNRRILYAFDFLKHYFDNFSGRFLFTHGDVNPRLSIQEMGELYIWDLPFLLMGVYWLIKKRERGVIPLILWMLTIPIPAGVAKETPHALRILSILPTYQIIIAYGVYQVVEIIKKKLVSKFFTSGESWLPLRSSLLPPRWFLGLATFRSFLLLSVICFLLSVNIYYYLHSYYIHYPINWSGEWQYGYKQMVSYVSMVKNNYDYIFVTNALGRPYIYFAFYQKYPLDKFLQEKVADRDWYGFWNVFSLGKIKFGFDDLSRVYGRILLVTTPGNLPDGYHLINSIKEFGGKEVFLIAEKI